MVGSTEGEMVGLTDEGETVRLTEGEMVGSTEEEVV